MSKYYPNNFRDRPDTFAKHPTHNAHTVLNSMQIDNHIPTDYCPYNY